MRSLADFQIYFDNPYGTYFSGQQISGYIIIRLVKQKRLQGIELRFLGEGEVEWTEQRREHEDGKFVDHTDYFNAREVYFENNYFIVGGPYGEMTLPPGEHRYAFQIIIPPSAPSSFEGELGHVRYTVKARIARPWRFDHECKRAFTIIQLLDLNLEPNIQEPVQRDEEKYLGFLCCRSRPITFVVSLPTRGFVPGQKCKAVVEVDNPTDKGITVKCNLSQKVTFTAYCCENSRSKEVKSIVARHPVSNVQPHGSLNTTVDLIIPALPTSYLRNCSCIDVSYKLQIKGQFSGVHQDVSIGIPIVIGSIPLREHFSLIVPSDQPMPTSSGTSDPRRRSVALMGHYDPSAPPDPSVTYPDMPPPTFEECGSAKINIRSKDDNEHVQGSMEFTPRYPTYHFK